MPSQARLPWVKIWTELWRDPDFTRMSNEMRGVYTSLFLYAAEQPARGTFPADDLQGLACMVARGDSDLLQKVIDYLTTEWNTKQGESHIFLIEGRYTFRKFADHQRKPSDEPEAVHERVARSRAARAEVAEEQDVKRDTNAIETRPRGKKEEERGEIPEEREKNKDRGPAEAEAFQVVSVLGVPRDDLFSVLRTVKEFWDRDAVAVATRYMVWQQGQMDDLKAGNKKAKVHKDRVKGWANSMAGAREKGYNPRSQQGQKQTSYPQPSPEERGLELAPPPDEQVWPALRDRIEAERDFLRNFSLEAFRTLSPVALKDKTLTLATPLPPESMRRVDPTLRATLRELGRNDVTVAYEYQNQAVAS